MAKQKDDAGKAGEPEVITSKFGKVDPAKSRDAGTFTADRRLYLDKDNRVVEHDDPSKVSLLVPAGGTLPMKRARELGLLGDDDGGHTVRSLAADAETGEAEAGPKAEDSPKATDTKAADAPKAATEADASRPATTGRHGHGHGQQSTPGK